MMKATTKRRPSACADGPSSKAMVNLPENSQRVRFGLFDADLATGELWNAGRRIKLQTQPFTIMTILLAHSGEVISRETLQSQVWGKDAVGDFDHSLITAINKIREALGDTADNPRFIETLPRRGYRWIAPVSILERPGTAGENTLESILTLESVALPDAVFVSTGSPLLSSSLLVAPSKQQLTNLATRSAPALDAVRPVGRQLARGNLARLEFWLVTMGMAALIAAPILWLGLRSTKTTAPLLRIEQLTRNGRVEPGKPSMESLPAAATDGLRIYVPVLSGGQSKLSQLDIHTGFEQLLPLPAEIASPTLGDISPDGSTLLLRSHLSPESEQPIWLVPISGGGAQRLTGVVGHDATWMPNGKGVLYASGNLLMVNNPDNGSSTLFATLKGRAFWLRWAPDHTLLRFTLLDPIAHTMQLGEIGADGTNFHTILDGWTKPASECCGVWTGDGRSFVFQSAHDGQAGSIDLWRLQEKSTSSPVRVTDGPLSYVAPIAPRIGSTVYFIGLESQSSLQQYNSSHQQFTASPAFLADAARVEYSRDGQWVTWTDTEGHQWRAHADGSQVLRLTPASLQVFMGHWSPDGTRLALMARTPGSAWQIYLLQAEGSSLETVLKEKRNAADPTFSADGQQIAFGRVDDVMGKEEGSRQLEILDLRTHKVESIPDSNGLFSPRWSPDGRYIAALSLDHRRLLLFDTAARTWRTLAATSAADPVWSADSKAIFFHATLAELQPIYRLTIANNHLEQIANFASFSNSSVEDYFFCGLGLNAEPIVRTRSGTGNLYSIDLAGR